MVKILTDTLKTIEHYKNTGPYYNELLDVLEEILILREEYRRNMKSDIFHVDDGLVEKKIAGGLPLIDFSTRNFDLTEAKAYFLRLLEIAGTRAPGETDEMAQKIKDGTIDFGEMIYGYFCGAPGDDSPVASEDEHLDILEMFMEESLRPALEEIAEKYAGVIARSGWSEGYCPICGREPKIGKIRKGERRFLFCNQCGFEWSFTRIKCPFCGNEEQTTLAYFAIEGEERYRVDVCNVCRRYIKMVDVSSGEETNLDVEDIATLHLDMLANEEGYD
ncbi:MAG: formate dehydrogenase accessory protein FdhE [Deltaproteobacteria bacterium]|nr:formate dehydrogenase accessory protein FdhE [Deltaproteobacteria bacterium]